MGRKCNYYALRKKRKYPAGTLPSGMVLCVENKHVAKFREWLNNHSLLNAEIVRYPKEQASCAVIPKSLLTEFSQFANNLS